MLGAINEFLPDLRRYLRAKARRLGLPVLAWYDLYSPVAAHSQPWPFETATRFIPEQFSSHWPRLGSLAVRAFRDGWIDAEPRAGKLDISACGRLSADASPILVNYRPVFFEVTTLAQELGHAYHNLAFAHRSFVEQQPPPTLSETASTMCEVIIKEAGLAQARPEEQLAILEAWLQSVLRASAEGTNWFLFEKDLFDRRKERALSVEEINALRVEKQRLVYGEGLDAEALHPFTWAAWPHLSGQPFYNFQYAFGALFALGLYAQYKAQPTGFWARYDALLASTGMADAAELAGRFGFELHAPEFWRSSLVMIRTDIDRFVGLVG
jgi:oligoendopeptidase F